ncbi:MAG: hypothetical protein HN726_00305 [Candidatus Magasanikbacteria bacterium]|jgi:uncharacterized oligopeptide transporter (OPT) family protein|nr:hypothetical protein [Candidatus Magasanikbacteria bacterium]MBT4221130.1 hypothetical protein [Candidatus Magasanikbacteria bacterium]MBT4350300.1 hypothetical protein [Candidatus Magasanikbacteria bacterium]MBT4541726.1 hypothetical protein [Candidatus Magasanikbacteria bacterium]MBT6253297.1 hypothetical protein [Candidatus Magasanikbacteria bacterium]
MRISGRTFITFIVLAILMGLNNIYSTLLTGWGDGGSIVAVILCVIFLKRKDSTILTYNLGQTIASAGGSVGFTTAMLAAVYVINPEWNPPLLKLGILVMSLSTLGVILAIPLKPYVVKWFFPSGVACATILKSVTAEDPTEEKRARKIMGISGILAALLTFPTKVSFTKGGAALWSKLSISKGIGLSLDPLLYGIGIVIGPRIGISMIIASLATAFLLIPELASAGLESQIGDYVKWIAIGLMTVPAFTSIFFSFHFKTERKLPKMFTPREEAHADRLTPLDWRLISIGGGVALVLSCWLTWDIFGVNPLLTIGCLLLGGIICVMLGKVASETDINAVRLGAIIILFVFSLMVSYGAVSLLGLAIVGAAIASIAVDLFYDLRTGYLVGANPRHQIGMQFLGVIVVSLVTVFFLHTLAVNFGFGEGKYFPAPGAIVWSKMASAVASKGASISAGVWWALGISSFVGVILSFLENHPKTKAWTPSAFAMGIAMLLGFDMSAAIFLGGLMRFFPVWWAKRQGEEMKERINGAAFMAGSAIFAAAALTGIIAVILITLGIVHLPTGH